MRKKTKTMIVYFEDKRVGMNEEAGMLKALLIGVMAACLVAACTAGTEAMQAHPGDGRASVYPHWASAQEKREAQTQAQDAGAEQTIEIGRQRGDAPLGTESLVCYDVALTGFADYEHDVDVVFLDAWGKETSPIGLSMAGIEGAPTDKTLTLRVTDKAEAGTYAFALCVNGVRSAAAGRLTVGMPVEAEELTAKDAASGFFARARYVFGGFFAAGTRLTLEAQLIGADQALLTIGVVNAKGRPADLADRLRVELSLPPGWTDADVTLEGPDGQQKSLPTAGCADGIAFVLEKAGDIHLFRKGERAAR